MVPSAYSISFKSHMQICKCEKPYRFSGSYRNSILIITDNLDERNVIRRLLFFNGACVAMAEYVCGSEEEFVNQMNERARGLGMENTNFVNCNGLDTD